MKRLFTAALLAALFVGTSCQPQPTAPASAPADANQTIDDILSRRSIRAYKEQDVPRDLLDKIVECVKLL